MVEPSKKLHDVTDSRKRKEFWIGLFAFVVMVTIICLVVALSNKWQPEPDYNRPAADANCPPGTYILFHMKTGNVGYVHKEYLAEARRVIAQPIAGKFVGCRTNAVWYTPGNEIRYIEVPEGTVVD